MNQEYKCPYCGQSSYAKSSKNKGFFTSWQAVSRHISTCAKNNHMMIIDNVHGPIALDEIASTSLRKLQIKYPGIQIADKLRILRKNGIKIPNMNKSESFSRDSIILGIQKFVEEHGSIPSYRDADASLSIRNSYLPGTHSCKKYFCSWNEAIAAAGFEPQIQNGFGVDTTGLDNHLYRSRAEAYFADNFLYKKYNYVIEPKYPKPHNRYYDWYIPFLDLYIELDGGIRPQVIAEKININKSLGRECLFIPISKIYKNSSLEQLRE